MTFLSLFSGCGGMDLGLERAGFKCIGQIEIMPYALKVLKKHWQKVPKHTDILTFCVQDSLVKVLQSLGKEKDLNTKELDSGEKWSEVCDYLSHNGFLEKMFPGFYPLMKAETFQKLSATCKKSGMAYHGEYLTVNSSESPNDVVDSSLSDVLEECVHQRYCLSRKAVEGIIRRTKKWGGAGYVFLQEMGKDKTRRMKRLSLTQLESMVMEEVHHSNLTVRTSLPQRSELKNQQTEFKGMSHKPLGQRQEVTLPSYGKTLILRKMTPKEKERLQGLPEDWTLVGES